MSKSNQHGFRLNKHDDKDLIAELQKYDGDHGAKSRRIKELLRKGLELEKLQSGAGAYPPPASFHPYPYPPYAVPPQPVQPVQPFNSQPVQTEPQPPKPVQPAPPSKPAEKPPLEVQIKTQPAKPVVDPAPKEPAKPPAKKSESAPKPSSEIPKAGGLTPEELRARLFNNFNFK